MYDDSTVTVSDARRNAARNALQVQDACNPLAVLASWAHDMDAIFMADPSIGNQFMRDDPASVLYLDKLADMLRRPGSVEYSRAYEACGGGAGRV